jgi:hypothetical protein
VLDVPHLATLIGRYVAGDSVEVAIDRGDVMQTLNVKLATHPPPVPPMPPAKAADKSGKPRPKAQDRPPRPAI